MCRRHWLPTNRRRSDRRRRRRRPGGTTGDEVRVVCGPRLSCLVIHTSHLSLFWYSRRYSLVSGRQYACGLFLRESDFKCFGLARRVVFHTHADERAQPVPLCVTRSAFPAKCLVFCCCESGERVRCELCFRFVCKCSLFFFK